MRRLLLLANSGIRVLGREVGKNVEAHLLEIQSWYHAMAGEVNPQSRPIQMLPTPPF